MALPASASAIPQSDPLDTNRLLTPSNSTLEERWAAWQARGAAHEIAVARRARIALPLFLVLVAFTAFLMFGR